MSLWPNLTSAIIPNCSGWSWRITRIWWWSFSRWPPEIDASSPPYLGSIIAFPNDYLLYSPIPWPLNGQWSSAVVANFIISRPSRVIEYPELWFKFNIRVHFVPILSDQVWWSLQLKTLCCTTADVKPTWDNVSCFSCQLTHPFSEQTRKVGRCVSGFRVDKCVNRGGSVTSKTSAMVRDGRLPTITWRKIR